MAVMFLPAIDLFTTRQVLPVCIHGYGLEVVWPGGGYCLIVLVRVLLWAATMRYCLQLLHCVVLAWCGILATRAQTYSRVTIAVH